MCQMTVPQWAGVIGVLARERTYDVGRICDITGRRRHLLVANPLPSKRTGTNARTSAAVEEKLQVGTGIGEFPKKNKS